jgi:hypothetical protein
MLTYLLGDEMAPYFYGSEASQSLVQGAIGGLIFVIGVVLIFFWRRHGRCGQCQGCGYMLRVPNACKCSECGTQINGGLSWKFHRRWFRRSGLLFVLLGVGFGVFLPTWATIRWSQVRSWWPLLPEWRDLATVKLSNGVVLKHQNSVLRLIEQTGSSWRIAAFLPDGQMKVATDTYYRPFDFSTAPNDFNGDGWTDMFVTWVQGGMYSDEGVLIAGCAGGEIEVIDFGTPFMSVGPDANGNGRWEFYNRVTDLFYICNCGRLWEFDLNMVNEVNAQFEVVPALTLMRAPPLSPEAYRESVIRFRTALAKGMRVQCDLITEVARLIYTGNAEQGWSLAHDAWPDEVEGRDACLAELEDRLEQSQVVELMQEVPIPTPPGA